MNADAAPCLFAHWPHQERSFSCCDCAHTVFHFDLYITGHAEEGEEGEDARAELQGGHACRCYDCAHTVFYFDLYITGNAEEGEEGEDARAELQGGVRRGPCVRERHEAAAIAIADEVVGREIGQVLAEGVVGSLRD